MDNILTSLGLIFGSVYFLGVVFVAALFLDHSDRKGWATFFTGLTVYLVGRYFNLSGKEIAMMLAAYIPVGIVWSIYKWKRHTQQIILNIKRSQTSESPLEISPSEYKKYQDDLNVYNNVGSIMIWVLCWAVSMVSSICGDVFDQLELIIRKHFIGIYKRISMKAMAELDKSVQVKEKK